MRPAILVPTVLFGLVLASACAPTMNWSKPNTDQASINTDLQDCERRAHASAAELPTAAQTAPSLGFASSGSGMTTTEALNTFPKVDASRENSLVAACMQDKGYREVAASDRAR